MNLTAARLAVFDNVVG